MKTSPVKFEAGVLTVGWTCCSSTGCSCANGEGGSDGEQGLDGAALVHRPVALGGLVQRQGEVEDLARVDGAVADELDELGQEAAHRGRSAVQVHTGEEQLVAGQRDVVADADVADV